jgi:predicted ester cyclase
MNASGNEGRIRRLVELIWNHRDLDAVGELCCPNVVVRIPHGLRLRGVAAYQDYVAEVVSQFPDLHVSVHELYVSEDHLALRYTWTGSFAGGMTAMGPAPLGSRVIVEGVGFYHLLDGRVLVGTCSEDWLSMYQQLGLVAGGPVEGETA